VSICHRTSTERRSRSRPTRATQPRAISRPATSSRSSARSPSSRATSTLLRTRSDRRPRPSASRTSRPSNSSARPSPSRRSATTSRTSSRRRRLSLPRSRRNSTTPSRNSRAFKHTKIKIHSLRSKSRLNFFSFFLSSSSPGLCFPFPPTPPPPPIHLFSQAFEYIIGGMMHKFCCLFFFLVRFAYLPPVCPLETTMTLLTNFRSGARFC